MDEQVVDASVPQAVSEIVEIAKLVPQDGTCGQIVVQIVTQEHISERAVKQVIDEPIVIPRRVPRDRITENVIEYHREKKPCARHPDNS